MFRREAVTALGEWSRGWHPSAMVVRVTSAPAPLVQALLTCIMVVLIGNRTGVSWAGQPTRRMLERVLCTGLSSCTYGIY